MLKALNRFKSIAETLVAYLSTAYYLGRIGFTDIFIDLELRSRLKTLIFTPGICGSFTAIFSPASTPIQTITLIHRRLKFFRYYLAFG